MEEKNLDFDLILNRKNTNSLKYDFARRRGYPEDILPMWVADMDFKTSSFVQEAIDKVNRLGVYGYTETAEHYYEIIKKWMYEQYGWELESERWLIKTPGVVFALGAAVQAYSEPGDSILILQPVYYPFSEIITDNERQIVVSNLLDTEDESGNRRYKIDYEDFEKKIIQNDVKIFILSNPHNPGGAVWTKEELKRIGDICLRHNTVVISDEIHADFIWKGKHQVFVNLDKRYREITVTCTSPTKSFNIAGLQISNIIIPDNALRKKFRKKIDAFGYSQANIFGISACEAAYRYGGEWLAGVKKYIWSNIEYMKKYIEDSLPQIKMFVPEGTYLVWLDFKGTGLSDEEINRKLIYEAKLWLDAGHIFGETGKGFQRINAACPRSVLTDALERIKRSFEIESG
ncbi:MAG: pyridoxal phosphate-dependent aminotransferase [Eubacterium sp.]|nr:pyridoxal phosphate-dependent aminotransferase [Eubacterium sp.]